MSRPDEGDLLRSINLRDIGGMSTSDGLRVRCGLVFRSAALSDLAGERLERLRALGIRTIVDLRRNAEREAQPTPWDAIGCSDYWCRDHHVSNADLGELARADGLTATESRAAMLALYRDLPYAQVESYRHLFRAVIDGRTPVLFHCAVGKDRTGVAAALLLAALDVPREAILADYRRTVEFDLSNSPHARSKDRRSPERARAVAPMLAVDPAYLDEMFAAVAARSGTIDGYLAEAIGLDIDDRRRLVEVMVQKPTTR